MANELPESEGEKRRFRAALDWLSQQSKPHDINQINEASQRFLLSPLDENFLIEQFIRQNSPFGKQ